jgi:hypothetical protein
MIDEDFKNLGQQMLCLPAYPGNLQSYEYTWNALKGSV